MSKPENWNETIQQMNEEEEDSRQLDEAEANYRKISRESDEPAGWIKCSDRMPESGIIYWVKFDGKGWATLAWLLTDMRRSLWRGWETPHLGEFDFTVEDEWIEARHPEEDPLNHPNDPMQHLDDPEVTGENRIADGHVDPVKLAKSTRKEGAE